MVRCFHEKTLLYVGDREAGELQEAAVDDLVAAAFHAVTLDDRGMPREVLKRDVICAAVLPVDVDSLAIAPVLHIDDVTRLCAPCRVADRAPGLRLQPSGRAVAASRRSGIVYIPFGSACCTGRNRCCQQDHRQN